MKYFITPELLHKYVDGHCTDEEIFVLHQWYDSFEYQDDPFEKLNETEQEALKMLMLEKFRASVRPSFIEDVVDAPRSNGLIKFMYTLSGIAAIGLVVWGIYFNNQSRRQKAADNFVITTASDVMLVNNETNSIFKQILSDGSVVWLSPKSQLQYPKKFIGTYRQVKMTGEAFFEVTKNHAHPFIIYSGGVITRVWGTSFRIKNGNDKSTEVSVVTGKVSVKLPEKEDSELMLYPKQKAVYTLLNHQLVMVKESERSVMKMWGKVSASFDNVSLDNALATLAVQYGIHIYTNDHELGKFALKADFTDQSLPDILEMLQNTYNAGYTINDTEIELYRKTQPISQP